MAGIVGKFQNITSTMNPLSAHVTHLRHLARPNTTQLILISRYNRSKLDAKKDSLLISAHISQALEFYDLSKKSDCNIRPMLQYYCFLNLAVAIIIAYQPTNYLSYRKHGVEDLTHKLNNINLSSFLVKIRSGAIPLFNSVISSKSIQNKKFRFNELIGAVPFLSYEINSAFKKQIIQYNLNEIIIEDPNHNWLSQISIKSSVGGVPANINRAKIEQTASILKIDYNLINQSQNSLTYQSKRTWTTKNVAEKNHKLNCFKIINFGGHLIGESLPGKFEIIYNWFCFERKELIPTLTASLLLSFSFASIVRYRPMLLKSLFNSRLNLLFDVFTNEIDGYLIPSFRNLLYRDEIFIKQVEFF